jgi:hypothetical protein
VLCDLKVTKAWSRGVTRKWTCQVESFRGGAGTEVPVKVSDYAADAGLQHVRDVPPDPPGRPRYRDPRHGVFSFRFFPVTVLTDCDGKT